MKCESNYIFMPKNMKPKADKKKSEEIASSMSVNLRNVYNILNLHFSLSAESKSEIDSFVKIGIAVITIEGTGVTVSFKIQNVKKITYLNVIAENGSKLKCLKCLDKINELLQDKNNEFEKYFIVIVSYDAVSEYYCNKIYPGLNELERKLRRLMLNIYILNFGENYFFATTEEKFQNKVKANLKCKDETERLKKYFYSLDYSDVEILLFNKKWTKVDEDKSRRFLEQNPKLLNLSESELRAAFVNICPRSDWERFFADKITEENIEDLIKEIHLARNNIAHCKFFSKTDYDKCRKMIKAFIIMVENAISIVENKEFVEMNADYLKEINEGFALSVKQMMDGLNASFQQLNKGMNFNKLIMNESMKSLSKAFSDSIRPLDEVMKSFNKSISDAFKPLHKLSENNYGLNYPKINKS